MYPIESNIAIPQVRTKQSAYPFREMNVGDSIFVPAEKAAAARVACLYFGRRNGLKFLSRKDMKDGVDGVRIWRVA